MPQWEKTTGEKNDDFLSLSAFSIRLRNVVSKNKIVASENRDEIA